MDEIDSLWDWDDPANSEVRFKSTLERATGSERDEILTQIARAQGLQGRFGDGHATLDDIHAPNGRVQVRVLLERGRLFNSSGDPVAAVPQFLAAVEFAAETGETGLEIDALHMLGLATPQDERIGWNEQAIARAEVSNDPNAIRWLGSLLNNTGWAYHDSGDFERALHLFTRASEWHEIHGSTETRRIARWSVGRAMRSLGQFETALRIQKELDNEVGDVSPDGYVFEEIAENLLALERPTEAAAWFQRAASVLGQDPALAEHEPERLNRLRRLSGDVK